MKPKRARGYREATPASIARELRSHLETACGEAAHDAAANPSLFPELKGKFARARKAGVTDLGGWYADEMYNDPSAIEDLLGDRLWEESEDNGIDRNAILDELAKGAHDALKKAIKNLRR